MLEVELQSKTMMWMMERLVCLINNSVNIYSSYSPSLVPFVLHSLENVSQEKLPFFTLGQDTEIPNTTNKMSLLTIRISENLIIGQCSNRQFNKQLRFWEEVVKKEVAWLIDEHNPLNLWISAMILATWITLGKFLKLSFSVPTLTLSMFFIYGLLV